MFRLNNVMIEDKKLAEVLTALAGKVLSMDIPQPVINAEKRDGKLFARTDGSLTSVFRDYVTHTKLNNFGIAEVRDFLSKAGRPVSSAPGILKVAKREGWLKAKGTGKGTTYIVVSR